MGDDELFRVESAVSATASGDLTWDRWPLDVSTALGLAGLRNPLGFAVVRYLTDEPSSARVWDVELHLASELINRGVAPGTVNQVARDAFSFWRDMRCRSCGGRGVASTGARCPACGGSGQRRVPRDPDELHTAISCLIEAEQRMEGQLRSRLKK